jgi:hypothetical protein
MKKVRLSIISNEASLRACLKNGRDRSPQRSGEWMANGAEHETLGNPAMASHSLAILADRPEVGPCLRVFFRQPLRPNDIRRGFMIAEARRPRPPGCHGRLSRSARLPIFDF